MVEDQHQPPQNQHQFNQKRAAEAEGSHWEHWEVWSHTWKAEG